MKTTEDKTKYNDIEQFKCPNCGGRVEFDSNIQKMKCPFCDSEFDVESMKEFEDISSAEDVQPEWEAYDVESGSGDWDEEEKAKIKHYICQSCAGEIITDATTVATQCPYCGNPVVIASELDGTLRPDLVIPFKLDKEAAKAALNRFLEGKKLLPNCFKDKNHIEEITGIYVPFWLYNCTAEGKAVYSARRVKIWSDPNFTYTKTDHFTLHREGKLDFIKVPADGSKKMDDTLMESIEPYNYEEAVDFQTAYLSGYLAEKYDVTADENLGRINERITESLLDMFERTIHRYDGHQVNHKAITLDKSSIEYALLPLWMLRTKYNGEEYIFAMNGQTGKFVGSLPIDRMKMVKHFLIAFAGSTVACSVLAILLSFFM